MTLEKVRIFGNPNIGIYVFVNNKFALVPKGIDSKAKRKISDTLSVEVFEVTIAKSTLIGVFVAGNDRAVLIPRITEEAEIKYLRDLGLPVFVIDTAYTALGNVVLSNNKAALLHPEIPDIDAERIAKALGVERWKKATIAGVPTVGSAAVITDKGGVVHPDTSESELNELRKFFDVFVDTGTVNFGIAFIKTGLLANNVGALVGERTTGPEIMRIMRALNLG
jgi:translation initiation factor 6